MVGGSDARGVVDVPKLDAGKLARENLLRDLLVPLRIDEKMPHLDDGISANGGFDCHYVDPTRLQRLAELCRRLQRSKAEELILAVRRASKTDAPDLKTAQRFLSRVVVNFDDTEEFFQKAGLWRVSEAASLVGQHSDPLKALADWCLDL